MPKFEPFILAKQQALCQGKISLRFILQVDNEFPFLLRYCSQNLFYPQSVAKLIKNLLIANCHFILFWFILVSSKQNCNYAVNAVALI